MLILAARRRLNTWPKGKKVNARSLLSRDGQIGNGQKVKIKDLPFIKQNGTHIEIWLKSMFDNHMKGMTYRPYRVGRKWYVSFLKDGDNEEKTQAIALTSISSMKELVS